MPNCLATVGALTGARGWNAAALATRSESLSMFIDCGSRRTVWRTLRLRVALQLLQL
jgi:hypothetical protein